MDNKRLIYHGTGGELFLIFLKNIFLTIVTVGIYSFWAKTNVQKYNASSLEWAGERFSFHGTGKERFIGFLKALGLFFVVIFVTYLVRTLLAYVPIPYVSIIVGYLIYLVLFLCLIPLIVVGKRKYLTSRMAYRNLRFGFDGKALEVAKIYLKGITLTILTLGIYYPWFYSEKESYLIANSRYGNTNFGFEADGQELFFIYLKGIFLSIITFGIYISWFIADLQNFIWDRTSFQGKKFNSDITGLQIFGNVALSYIIIIFSFGFGFAWVVVRMTKLFLETISLEAEVDFTSIEAKTDTTASATTEGIEAISNALDSFLG
ncbi:YjgN family protein [Leptospira ognonensis]|nr:DUF898 family protein [Leptospira ognonensis]